MQVTTNKQMWGRGLLRPLSLKCQGLQKKANSLMFMSSFPGTKLVAALKIDWISSCVKMFALSAFSGLF